MSIESKQIWEVRLRYQASLHEKADMVHKYLCLLISDDKLHKSVLDNIHADLHKLAGSSGMYGYHDISDLARLAMAKVKERNLYELELQLLMLRNLIQQHSKA